MERDEYGMTETVHFELVSPERLLMSVEANGVVVPGTEGDFMVLPKHSPMMSTIRPGVVSVDEADKSEATRIYIRGGFAEVTPKGLVILAEQAIFVADLSKSDLEQHITDAKEDLEDAKTSDEAHMAEQTIAQLTELLDAVKG